MIFDAFARIAEKHIGGSVLKDLEASRLFVFPGRGDTDLPKSYSEDQRMWLHENFFLPFRIVCVEDEESCVLLKDPEEGARGAAVDRAFVDCIPIGDVPGVSDDLKDDGELYQINFGTAAYHLVGEGTSDLSWMIEGGIRASLYATRKRVVYFASDDALAGFVTRKNLHNAGTALQEVMFLNTPDRFILEKSPTQPRRRKGRDKKPVSRSHERPVYTILKPHEIREQMGLPEESAAERTKPRPHERRAHTRTFRAERYKAKRGKTIIIPATWVGPSEAVVKGKRYRVLLDR